jgi:hypothetical protein
MTTNEAKKMKGKDPCWDGYKMLGTKPKGGKQVPNCIPEETMEENIARLVSNSIKRVTAVKPTPQQKADMRMNREETESKGHYEEADEHLSKANDAEARGDKMAYHHHMADHHDSMSQWHEEKGRSGSADKHAEKADMHSDKYTQHARGMGEANDPGEYDYEGDMARSDLRSIIHNAQQLHDMMEDNTNLPEWLQAKITKAEDYISSAANYMRSEMNEEVVAEVKSDDPDYDESLKRFKKGLPPKKKIDEVSAETQAAYSKASHKDRMTQAVKVIGSSGHDKEAAQKLKVRNAGLKRISDRIHAKTPKVTPAPKPNTPVANDYGYGKGRYMGDSVELQGNKIDELSPATLSSYKKAAGQSASNLDKAADKEFASGNRTAGVALTNKANKRFSGIVRATKKQ